jgi:diguanylate cyclase (GGDEF)-like protein
MRIILAKSVLVGLLSLLASLILSFMFVPLMGGKVAGAGLVMTIVCPLAIGIPASVMHFYQTERIRRARAETSDALAKLARAYEELRLQARLDGLTGVLNRGAFRDDLERFSRSGITGVLIFLDLDYFKSINDRYGHATGDEALRLTGLVLAAYRRQFDIAGRLGGEEFALFQGGLKPSETQALCEEVRALIERMEVRAPSGKRVPVSASIGACYCAAGFDADECLKAADVNLYEAKSQGRNRVVASL